MSTVAKLAPLMSSVRMDWQTPRKVLDLVRLVGRIGLDPCTTDDNPVGADDWIAPPSDGLLQEWPSDDGAGAFLTYVNPPYGRSLGAWMAKCNEESANGAEIIALVPARTDTRWWEHVTQADAICFWRGRLTFEGAPNAAPFPSALVYWGERRKRFVQVFGAKGWIP